MNKYLVCFAMEAEARAFLQKVKVLSTKQIPLFHKNSKKITIRSVSLPNHKAKIYTFVCGVGHANALTATACAINYLGECVVLLAGTCAGVPGEWFAGRRVEGAAAGEDPGRRGISAGVDGTSGTGLTGFGGEPYCIIASGFTYAQTDLSAFGYAVGQMPGAPERFDVSALIKEKVAKAYDMCGIPAVCGVVAGVSTFVDGSFAREIRKTLADVVAVDMEGAFLAHLCWMFGVQFAYLKCVSDMCAKVDYERNLASASKSSAAAALQFILLDAVFDGKTL